MPTASARPARVGRWPLLIPIVVLGVGAGACGGEETDPRAVGADPGKTVEAEYEWTTADGAVPRFTDVTEEWGLGGFENKAKVQAAGGVAMGDLDGDGWTDLLVAGGDLNLFYGGADGMIPAAAVVRAEGQVASVGVADLDEDGLADILVGVIGGDDLIVWGGSWSATRDPSRAERTLLGGGTETVALIAADLGGDRRPDLLRLSHDVAEPDMIWLQTGTRVFNPEPLPQSYRRSFAAEIVDLDQDGLLDIWVTRDVGWITGTDSIYTRRGDRDGPWVDVATELNAALAIDGMGIALADLNDDGILDAYVTDIGENDILFSVEGGGYAPASDTGAGRIRPPGAGVETVSSSWAATAGDLNLDGIVDLVVANGGFGGADIVNKVPGTAILDLDTPALFLGLGGGRFADVWPQLGQTWKARIRGMAVGDLDRDGDADLVFVANAGGMRVYRNEVVGPSVTLAVPDSACAAGFVATVTGATTTYRAVLVQHSFLGANEASLTVGTAGAPVEISVARPGLPAFTRSVTDGNGRTVFDVPCR